MRSLVTSGQLGSVNLELFDCVACKLGKQSALPFNTNESISFVPFDLIHSNVWGQAPIPTMGESRYFVIFINDYSQYTLFYLLQNRSELSKIYSEFKMAQT
jgi:hypothetical protein